MRHQGRTMLVTGAFGRLDLLVPIRPVSTLGLPSATSSSVDPIAVVVLRLNPRQHLFPMVPPHLWRAGQRVSQHAAAVSWR